MNWTEIRFLIVWIGSVLLLFFGFYVGDLVLQLFAVVFFMQALILGEITNIHDIIEKRNVKRPE